jgi:MFS family permease
MAATDGVGKAFAIDLVPTHLKATGLGLLGTFTGISTLLASLSAGLIWDHFGASFTFIYGAFGALVAFLILLFFKTKKLSPC